MPRHDTPRNPFKLIPSLRVHAGILMKDNRGRKERRLQRQQQQQQLQQQGKESRTGKE